jgi:hemoglobin
MTPRQSIYEMLGGEAAMEAAVGRFYELVTADPLLAPYFNQTDMQRLRGHQMAFLTQALGGPAAYKGATMQKAHAHLAIEQRHFDAVVGHLLSTLGELKVPQEIVDQIVARLAPLADAIVNTKN